MMARLTNFVTLIVMDGWGIASASDANAISLANTPNISSLWASFPHTLLTASGVAVGLPKDEVGNTETGHLNLGAGRIVYQDLPRINLAITDGSFFNNSAFLGAIEHAKVNNSNLHIMGLIGSGGVHSNIEHLFALLHLARIHNFDRVFLHLFTDGRDSLPTSAPTYFQQLEQVIATEKVGTVATIMGRYFAMDRDFRWERTEKAYIALTGGIGRLAKTPREAIETSYKEGKTDEQMEPFIMADQQGMPIAKISDNDSVIFFNFRIDRPRQLTRAFVVPDFEKHAQDGWEFDPYMIKYYKKHNIEIPSRPVFTRGEPIKNLYFVTMTQYAKSLPTNVAFPPEMVSLPLGRVISERGLRQVRAAESEKERFVGFYFNGQQEQSFPGEDRLIIASPNVPTYDKKPEMSARELTRAFISDLQVNQNSYSFALINFANVDMVGHTGDIEAAKIACSVVDECVGNIVHYVEGTGGVVVITADHGNAEEMLTADGKPSTEHSANPVPFIITGKPFLGKYQTLSTGVLADVAPTILNLLGIEKPETMTGRNLLA